MSTYILGQILDSETITTEYKEFRLDLIYDKPETFEKLYKNTLDLKYIFKEVMYKNMKKYACKYTSSFFNSRFDGVIYFGVSDFCEVIGIPMMPEDINLECSIMKNIISNEITNNILGGYDISKILDKIELTYEEVNTSDKSLFCYIDSDEYIRNKKIENEKYLVMYDKYLKQKEIYISTLERYRRSINFIINQPDIREDFKSYLIRNGVLEEFTDLLRDDIIIKYTDMEIKNLKHDKSNLVHWITNYRDVKSDDIIKYLKPSWDYRKRSVDPYFCILQDFKPMVTNIIERGFKMYIIKVEFKFGNLSPKDGIISYNNNSSIKSPIRSLNKEGLPCCKF